MKITILYGGKSSEHEISLISASYVARNIDTSKYFINLIGIDKDGKWYWQDQSELERIKEDENAVLEIKKDFPVSIIPGGGKKNGLQVRNYSGYVNLYTEVVFPVLHGTNGEDGTVQGLLEMAEIPYVGCTTMASALTMDKEKTKQIWEHSGLPIVPYICARKYQAQNDEGFKKLISEIEEKFRYPVFVKPCCAGSSVGATKASNAAELKTSLAEAFKWDDKILIEDFIKAREIECSVMGNAIPKAFVPGEIAPKHEFYDYDAKYTDPNGAELLIPAPVDDATLSQIQDLAKKAYIAVDASGLSRIDFFIDRENGRVMLNEINTMPGFTSISMFPKMCENGGLKYKDLIEELINLAVEKHDQHAQLQTSR